MSEFYNDLQGEPTRPVIKSQTCAGLYLASPTKKDTSEIFQDGDVPDVFIERVHGVVTGEIKEVSDVWHSGVGAAVSRRTCSALEEL